MYCDNCGNLEHILIDGYNVDDRLLEGVLIECRLENGKWVASFQEEDSGYVSRLNETSLLMEAVWVLENLDIAECPQCGGDVDVPQLT
jgi:hypothetical protein